MTLRNPPTGPRAGCRRDRAASASHKGRRARTPGGWRPGAKASGPHHTPDSDDTHRPRRLLSGLAAYRACRAYRENKGAAKGRARNLASVRPGAAHKRVGWGSWWCVVLPPHVARH